jgi:hypothetical protein
MAVSIACGPSGGISKVDGFSPRLVHDPEKSGTAVDSASTPCAIAGAATPLAISNAPRRQQPSEW